VKKLFEYFVERNTFAIFCGKKCFNILYRYGEALGKMWGKLSEAQKAEYKQTAEAAAEAAAAAARVAVSAAAAGEAGEAAAEAGKAAAAGEAAAADASGAAEAGLCRLNQVDPYPITYSLSKP
jgi:hypothetical protein